MRSIRRSLLRILASALVACVHQGALAQGAMVGILEGQATLIRQASKFALAEGVALRDDDIIETVSASFAQVEFTDGGRIGIGPDTRLVLSPRGATRGAVSPRIHVLQGWVKLTQPSDRPVSGAQVSITHVTPLFQIMAVTGATIFSQGPSLFSAFAESGSVKVSERGSDRAPIQLNGGDFLLAKADDKPAVSKRPAPDFIAQMPRQFRDPLPARAERFRANPVTPKPLGEVGYADVAHWLTAEPDLRRAMVPRWRPRLRDKAFRAAMIEQLASHPEWDPLLFPEKAARKRAEEKRQRELRAAAAEEAAARAASAPKAAD